MTSWTTLYIEAGVEASADLVIQGPRSRFVGATDSVALRLAVAFSAENGTARPAPWLDLATDGRDRRAVVLTAPEDRKAESWLSLAGVALDAMKALRLETLRLPSSAAFGSREAFEAFITGALLHSFRLDQGRRTQQVAFQPAGLIIDADDEVVADRVRRSVNGVNRARAWTEQPANLLTPEVFATEAGAALAPLGVVVRVLDLAALQALGAHALLAVAAGSHNPPCLLVAEWRGDPDRAEWDAAFVGKGVTFDSGGLNLKIRPVIEKMKFDMGGAASILGALEVAAERKSRTNLVVVIPMTENSIGSNSYRPGDVINSLAGLTIEVQNTDAEGRLILADGITYAIDTYKPARIVDVATLTGAILGVLHEEYAGLFTTDDDLAQGLLAAGEATGESLWRLPLTKRQNYLVESSVADLANMGAPGFLGIGVGSPAAAAKFLEPFAEGTPWAHIDIAGVAWATRRAPRTGPGASGFGVALLDRWITSLEGDRERLQSTASSASRQPNRDRGRDPRG